MITRDVLDNLAKKLMFKMNDEEYKTLENEFDVILKQMEFIDKIDGIEEVTPMTFPFELNLDDDYLREDVYKNEIDFNEISCAKVKFVFEKINGKEENVIKEETKSWNEILQNINEYSNL